MAGNTGRRLPFAHQYDATAPKLTAVKAEVAKGIARLAWKRPADAVSVQIVRTPRRERPAQTRSSEAKETFVDRTVRKGVRYRYEVTGGRRRRERPRRSRSPPRPGRRSTSRRRGRRPRSRALAWEPSRGARYYNVQLYRNGVKILSLWPKQPKLRIPRSWRYAGKSFALTAALPLVRLPALGTMSGRASAASARLEQLPHQALAEPTSARTFAASFSRRRMSASSCPKSLR